MRKKRKSEKQVIKELGEDYPYIVKWCRHMGSFDYYTINQLRLAKTENAPATAIYRSADDGVWQLAESIKNEDVKHWILNS